MESRDHMILEKIVTYCDRIADNIKRFGAEYSVFEADYTYQDACCMCIVQIGELVAQLSDAVKQQHPAIPWRVIKDTRNFYVHSYGAIDLPSVWTTLTQDIPVLKEQCEALL